MTVKIQCNTACFKNVRKKSKGECLFLVCQEINKCSGTCSSCPCSKTCTAPSTSKSAVQWYNAASLGELFAVMNKHSSDALRLVGGNTAKGQCTRHHLFSLYLRYTIGSHSHMRYSLIFEGCLQMVDCVKVWVQFPFSSSS